MTIIKQTKGSLFLGNYRDPKFESLEKQLRIAFSEIKRDITLHEEKIESMKDTIDDLKKKIRKLEDEKQKTTPLMEDILSLIKIETKDNSKGLNSKDIFSKLKLKGIKIHEKSVPRAIKSLLKLELITKTSDGKNYLYVTNNLDKRKKDEDNSEENVKFTETNKIIDNKMI
jgi:Fe2+ or Zn2+ uptake regulation protein